MAISCVFGLHKWDGCKCTKCGKARDEGHDWSKDCEKCAVCGKTRPTSHVWDGCKCTKCGKARDEGHDWSKDCEKCASCGKVRSNAHNWVGSKCAVCGLKDHVTVMELLSDIEKDLIVRANSGKTDVDSTSNILLALYRKTYMSSYSTDVCGYECTYPPPRLINKGTALYCPNCGRLLHLGDFDDRHRNKIARDIGEALFKKGGIQLMRSVAAQFETRGGKAYSLSVAWDGVGDWID